MDFKLSIITCLNKYATFSGRASRSEFWYFTLFTILAGLVASVIDSVLVGPAKPGEMQPVNTLVSLALFLPSISVQVRRLHDKNLSGWWWWIIITGIGILVLLYWNVTRGTTGVNRFGDDPLGGVAQIDHDKLF